MVFRLSKKYTLLFLTMLMLSNGKAENKEQQVKVALRAIGHEFLLQLGDSTSRVLPIEKEDARYKLTFERELGFEPEVIVLAMYKVMDDAKFLDKAIVEVEKCGEKLAVYGYALNLEKNGSDIHCRSRALPIACYAVYVTLLENESPLPSKGYFTGVNHIYMVSLFIIGFGLAITV